MRQLWRGVPVDSTDGLWDSLDSEIDSTLRGRLRTSDVLDACERISQRILSGDTARRKNSYNICIAANRRDSARCRSVRSFFFFVPLLLTRLA